MLPASSCLADSSAPSGADWTMTATGAACIAIFLLAYLCVALEEVFHLRKSIPVIIGAGVIWLIIGIAFSFSGQQDLAAAAVRHNLLEFSELFLFLLSAITFVNTMEERQVFDTLRAWLIRRGLSLRGLFWLTGGLAFIISPIADNLTTTLVMGTVAISVGAGNPKFIAVACINIVVAANAGGTFSPFGDITTLMVWQKGVLTFGEFFRLFVPALVNWLVPSTIMMFAFGKERPALLNDTVELRPGAAGIVVLFVLTLAFTVILHHFTHLPPFLGMMTGLGVLKLYSFLHERSIDVEEKRNAHGILAGWEYDESKTDSFDIFKILMRTEWDTLMFFYGVILCVGGLGTLGYLAALSRTTYGALGPTWANILVGLMSAVVDNIPVMFAVLSMNPEMSHNQWLLVTLTAGVGGSLLSIGSAAGVALMGHARGVYTFLSHLKWSWAVALGYAVSIWVHLMINGR
jgi:Na+/H+ antiporter NhaD/arsenite permease-like protein